MRPKPVVYFRLAVVPTERSGSGSAYCFVHDNGDLLQHRVIRTDRVLAINPLTGGFETPTTIYLPQELHGPTDSIHSRSCKQHP